MTRYRTLIIAVAALAVGGCSGRIASSVAQNCSEELSLAEAEMDRAKADGLSEAVSISKAAALITAAAVQKQFEKYEGCIEKAQRARAYIADARKR